MAETDKNKSINWRSETNNTTWMIIIGTQDHIKTCGYSTQ